MKDIYLEVTYRRGQPFAAYLYLPRERGEKASRSSRADGGMVVDFGAGGKPIGIELTAPDEVTLEALNRLLHDLGLPSLTAADLAPLQAA